MSDAIEREKLAVQKLAAQRLGINVDARRVHVSEVTNADQVADMLSLPVDPDNDSPLQDPVTGQLYVVFGVSSFFGEDIMNPG